MVKYAVKTSVLAALLMGTGAWASEDVYQAGDTVLSITQDKYKMEIRDPLVNPGNSTRLYFRPRNGNCTSATYDDGGKGLTLHDDPMCNDSKWGWISLDVPSKEAILADADKKIEVGAKLGGTLKSYKVGFTASLTPDGQVLIAGIGTK